MFIKFDIVIEQRGINSMKEKKSFHLYADDEKLEIIQDHLNNHISIRACATKYNVAITSIVMWLRT